jgi:hypothetical protein
VASGGNLDPVTIVNLIKGQIEPSIPILQQSIPVIIGKIYALNPNTKIVLYNFYNPFIGLGPLHPINMLGNPLIQSINLSLEKLKLGYPGLVIANAYVIGLDPSMNLILGDIHPSLAGHEQLAQLGLNALGLD